MAAVAMEATTAQCKKLMGVGLSIFRRRFNSSKCKTMAKMARGRIKLLRNKREVVVRQMRRDVALLLQSRQDATARIRVEHVIREQNIMAANEIIELFCELIAARMSIIAKQRECPTDLKEGISSLIFAAPRCADIPELLTIRNVFEKKYGKDFVAAATDLRPNCGVNRTLIEKLSVRTPTGEVKLKVMKEIAKEYQIEWDTTETEMELLKPPEETIEGPRTFVSAASMPVKPVQMPSVEPNKLPSRSPPGAVEHANQFENAAMAAEAAADSAKKAIAAAAAAAYLANKNSNQHAPRFINSASLSMPGNDTFSNSQDFDHQSEAPWRTNDSQNFRGSQFSTGMVNRRHTYHARSAHSDIKFDESDCDEEIEMERTAGSHLPPNRPPPAMPSHRPETDDFSSDKQDKIHGAHPKLPDYDSLAARFEALKHHRKSMP